MIKKILFSILLVILLSPCVGSCESTVTLGWDYNGTFDISGFNIYRTQESGVYDTSSLVITIPDPNINEYTDPNIPDGIYYWVVSAFRNHIPAPGIDPQYTESDYSNEVRADLLTSKLPPPETVIKSVINVSVEVNIQQ